MAKKDSSSNYRADDWLATITEWAGEKALWFGGALTLISFLGLLFLAFRFSSGGYFNAKELANAADYVNILQKLLIGSTFAFALGMTGRFWGDFALPLTLFILAAFFFAATWWVPLLVGTGGSGENLAIASGAIGSMSLAGILLGIFAILLQVIDGYVRIKYRVVHGAKGDLLKYGKDEQEDRAYKNVFMGKCWQLPFCRKFVREQCPIYHSKRTCWRERVGCMCEEEVIRGAMEGKLIPKEAVAAAKFIPYNTKVPPAQKAERCRQCVIYNEHQKHKYRLMVPVVFVFMGLVYVALHQQLLMSVSGWVANFDKSMKQFTFSAGEEIANKVEITGGGTPGIFEEVLLFCIMMFVLSQLLRVVEFCVFKLKI
ncbi:MAG: hypothetical protein U0R49_11940 [Fimbriimonadales bacterium]